MAIFVPGLPYLGHNVPKTHQLDIAEVDLLDNKHTKYSDTNLLLDLLKHPIKFTMVITVPQNTVFSTDSLQMGLSDQTYAYLDTEVINSVDDLVKFNYKGVWRQII